MSTSTSSASSTGTAAAAAVSSHDEQSLWVTLGGLALGVGGFLAVQGIQHVYRTQKKQEAEWVKELSTSSKTKGDLPQNQQTCIYLDYNGTTPIYKDVLQAMWPFLTQHFGNPSSSHAYGKVPRQAIDQARAQILDYLFQSNDPVDSIWFTGCGTESDNLAVQLAIQSSGHVVTKKHVVTCNVEHPAIEGYLKHLEAEGTIEVTYVPVQADGRVQANDIIAALQDNTILVTVMLANNESGAMQPIQEIATECRERGILIHTDAAQAAGKASCAVADLGYPDMISIVGHKLGAPKGIAALYVRPGCLDEHGRKMPHSHGVLLIGGGQEFGRRGGTENTPYIVGLGYAAQKAQANLAKNALHMESLRSRLLKNLEDLLGKENVRANGPESPSLRLCNTLSVGIKDIHSGDLLAEVGHLVAASAGATCHSAGAVSSVLRAMNVPMEFARGTLRLSVGPKTTAEEVDRAAAIIADATKRQWESKLESNSQ